MHAKIEGKVSPIIWVIFIALGLGLLVFCSSKLKNKRTSPKANIVVSKGNHIENLAAHELVSIESIGTVEELHELPLWVNHNIDESKPKVYDGLFWEIEPWGEYLYFLAGDYKKNEKGLLRFSSSTTSVRVEISFEDDVINVAKIDGTDDQSKASNIQLDPRAIKNLRFVDIEKISNNFTSINGAYFSYVSLEKILPESATGRGRLIIKKQSDHINLTMIYEEFREPKLADETERYLKILIQSKDPTLSIEDAIKLYSDLIAKYSEMPYVHVSGSTRM